MPPKDASTKRIMSLQSNSINLFVHSEVVLCTRHEALCILNCANLCEYCEQLNQSSACTCRAADRNVDGLHGTRGQKGSDVVDNIAGFWPKPLVQEIKTLARVYSP